MSDFARFHGCELKQEVYHMENAFCAVISAISFALATVALLSFTFGGILELDGNLIDAWKNGHPCAVMEAC